ncbi:hypothetical protein LIPSTDRAFT_29666 [Lipomyces starkeyi NRRL Y-11557]|uniref:Uncharacterized protein n=1 Tax=Lipomyces starkeyi NRRL Y-11557 TaxID=675824 RepID=A0A1E3Q0E2_LIPST|nr:hypothetical protein LIPSTDRAFT_29666 [Lipomyces starkeyi NRRL Y-11557]
MQHMYFDCLTETPKYRSPKPGAIQFSDSDFRMSVVHSLELHVMVHLGRMFIKDILGFMSLKAHLLKSTRGTISVAKFPSSQKYQLVRDGSYVIGEDEIDLGLIVGDFIPTDESAVADIRSAPVQLSGKVISKVLRAGIERSAFQHFSRLK